MEIIGDFTEVVELQKYMNFSKFMGLLDTKKIFLSKASGFEDKTEGGLSLTFKMINSGDAMLIDIAMNISWPTAHTLSQEEVEAKNKEEEDAFLLYENRHFDTVFGEFSAKEISYDEINNQYKEWIDVSCWHANKYESMAMWKIYGENEGAVCIITDIDRIKESITPIENYNLIIAKINYISLPNEEFTTQHKLAPFMHKSRFYDYEHEVRLIGYDSSCPFRDKRETPGTMLEVNTNNLIKEIRVSPYASNWFFDLITSVCKKYDLNTEVIRSKMHGTV
ncbi:hypothetical protein [Pantoea coffeiphila]|uniref:hypothetical protein n=1 Tax=Pantoea coffeiphila TaxID=1465635 RepID=UPI001961C26F|nr:hypothetical protein [Pantoea coffeiphila]MBM7341247.1 hypothetical protein [Pantoea coffeiphila]